MPGKLPASFAVHCPTGIARFLALVPYSDGHPLCGSKRERRFAHEPLPAQERQVLSRKKAAKQLQAIGARLNQGTRSKCCRQGRGREAGGFSRFKPRSLMGKKELKSYTPPRRRPSPFPWALGAAIPVKRTPNVDTTLSDGLTSKP